MSLRDHDTSEVFHLDPLLHKGQAYPRIMQTTFLDLQLKCGYPPMEMKEHSELKDGYTNFSCDLSSFLLKLREFKFLNQFHLVMKFNGKKKINLK